ncbi:hypothetical protein BaRGS_00004284 [Batillaria attramentaria]|uniref:Ribosomal protein S14 n=1 Tax=Batillaria attramentaria TaxID=370345 RepID=A0ABD0LZ58_9CAEN
MYHNNNNNKKVRNTKHSTTNAIPQTSDIYSCLPANELFRHGGIRRWSQRIMGIRMTTRGCRVADVKSARVCGEALPTTSY